ncbi:expressed unknown protein [Seminavis robusta]|uniref:PDZ domain-containing protein n=1 Tax=Seminavis robusta TaxID=568900 RepID=A0A9N8EEH0_9STRA|nr:expressed unknown protein [Seminavis robusta]|eukprot:Sro1063_g237040.1 n/a (408) ;mRNA; f:3611-4834
MPSLTFYEASPLIRLHQEQITEAATMDHHHNSSHFEEASAVSAETIADTFSTTDTEDDLPLIELSSEYSANEKDTQKVHVQEGVLAQLCSTAIAVAELVTTARDIESGWLARSPRAEFISATFVKPDASTGLGFNLCNKEPRIASILDGSLASSSPLRVGDRLISINKKQCSSMHSASIRKLLQSLMGPIEIVVHNKGGSPVFVESMVTKSHKREPSGLVLKRSGDDGKLLVSNIREGHVFVNSLINKGDEMVSINRIACHHLSAVEAASIVKETPKHVTVIARTLRETGVVVAELPSTGRELRAASNHSTAAAAALRTNISPPLELFTTRQQIVCAVLGLLGLLVVVAIILTNSFRDHDGYMYSEDYPYQWHDGQYGSNDEDNNYNNTPSVNMAHGTYGCWSVSSC